VSQCIFYVPFYWLCDFTIFVRCAKCEQWRIQGGGGGGRPLLAHIFFSKKPPFSVYSSLCAFATNDYGTNKLSSVPPFKIFGSATESEIKRTCDILLIMRCCC